MHIFHISSMPEEATTDEAVEGQRCWRDSKAVDVNVGSRQCSTWRKAPSRSSQDGTSTWHKAFLWYYIRSRSTAQQPYLSCEVKINPLYHWGWNAEPLFFFHNVCFQAGYVSVPGNIHSETLAAGSFLGGFSAHWQRKNTSFTPSCMPYQRNKEQSGAFSGHALTRSVH